MCFNSFYHIIIIVNIVILPYADNLGLLVVDSNKLKRNSKLS